MAFDISQFIQNGLVYGGARPSLFQIQVSSGGLENMMQLDTSGVAKFTYACQGSELPPARLGQIPVPYFGRDIKVAGPQEFDDWTVTVMNDEDFLVREMFESWANSINGIQTNVRQPGLNQENYKADFSIYQYGKDGTIIRAYTMIGAWPRLVGPIQLSWEDKNRVETFQVQFAYDYWLPDESAAVGTSISYQNDATGTSSS
ncbi:MAG: phage tail protein [Legionella sp.]|uniref:phage tail protein n=1 Tax=Legionella sp. TaxID=459 RepID=UPI002842C631|nr:phage tail protein [Legionella sp.]